MRWLVVEWECGVEGWGGLRGLGERVEEVVKSFALRFLRLSEC